MFFIHKHWGKVEVIVDTREDKSGQLILSHRKARVIKAWDRVNDAHDKNEIVQGFVKCRTKGGMIVDVFGIEAFLPGSQIDIKPVTDFDDYLGKEFEFKIVKINELRKNVVLSWKELLATDLHEKKKKVKPKKYSKRSMEGRFKNFSEWSTIHI